MHHRGSGRSVALLLVTAALSVACVVGAVPAQGSPASGPAPARACPGFTVRANGLDYRFYAVRARRTSCRTVRRLVRAYFSGPSRKTGPSANDPYRVRGWDFWIIDLVANGRRGKRTFFARYRADDARAARACRPAIGVRGLRAAGVGCSRARTVAAAWLESTAAEKRCFYRRCRVLGYRCMAPPFSVGAPDATRVRCARGSARLSFTAFID